MISITLPYLPPSTNDSHFTGNNDMRIPPPHTIDFRMKIMEYFQENDIRPIKGYVKYHLTIAPGKERSGKVKVLDSSNYVKQLEDSLNGLAWFDDSLVVDYRVTKDMESSTRYFTIRIWGIQENYFLV